MCRHLFNPQVMIQASCCNRWYECSECHDETNDHPFVLGTKLRLKCKLCDRVFQKDLSLMTEKDRKCEGCENIWNIRGITPEKVICDKSRAYIQETMMNIIAEAGKK